MKDIMIQKILKNSIKSMRKNSNPNKDKKNDDAQTPIGGEKNCA